MPQYKIPGNSYNRVGRAEGILVGGNLSNYSWKAATNKVEPIDKRLDSVDKRQPDSADLSAPYG